MTRTKLPGTILIWKNLEIFPFPNFQKPLRKPIKNTIALFLIKQDTCHGIFKMLRKNLPLLLNRKTNRKYYFYRQSWAIMLATHICPCTLLLILTGNLLIKKVFMLYG